MGLLGLRRKPWKDADPKKRLAGVADVPRSEQGTLFHLASQDEDKSVRQAAARRIKSVSYLERLLSGSDQDVAQIARDRLAGVALTEIKQRNLDQARNLLDEVTEQSSLTEIVLQASDEKVRAYAFGILLKVDDPSPSLLSRIAIQVEDESQARQALEKVDKLQQLKEVAKKAKLDAIQGAAKDAIEAIKAERKKPSPEKQRRKRLKEAKRLQAELQALTATTHPDEAEEKLAALRVAWDDNLAAYDELAQEDDLEAVAKDFVRLSDVVSKRIADIRSEAQAAAAAEAALRECCEKWEQRRQELGDSVDQATLENLADAANAEWQQIDGHDGRFAKRFAAIFATQYAGPVAEDAAESETEAAAAIQLPAADKERVEAILREAETLIEDDDWREADYRYKELHKEWSTLTVDLPFEHPLRKGFHDAYVAFKNKCFQRREERRQLQEENLVKLEALLHDMEALAEKDPQTDDEFRDHFHAVKAVQDAWSACKPVPYKEAGPLRKQFRKICDKAYKPLRKHREEEEWKHFGNMMQAEELIEKAEALTDAEPNDETLEAIKAIQQEWKDLGRLPRERHEELWNQFKAAGDKVFEHLEPLFVERDKQRETNYDEREKLIVALAELCDADRGSKKGPEGKAERKERAAAVKALQEQWKNIGPAPRDKDQEQWGRFKEQLDKFYGQRRKAFEGIAAEQTENLHQKLALIAEAEGLAETAEAWKAGNASNTDEPSLLREVKSLQQAWRQVGHIPKDKIEGTWNSFRGHCDRVFTCLSNWFSAMDAERQENLAQKQAILEKIEAYTKEENPNAFREEVKTLQAQWREIGHIPRDKMDEIFGRYQTLCDIIFNADKQITVEAVDVEEAAPAAEEAAPTTEADPAENVDAEPKPEV